MSPWETSEILDGNSDLGVRSGTPVPCVFYANNITRDWLSTGELWDWP